MPHFIRDIAPSLMPVFYPGAEGPWLPSTISLTGCRSLSSEGPSFQASLPMPVRNVVLDVRKFDQRRP